MKEVKAKWFEGEGILNIKFKNINNKIEIVKYVHKKENHQMEWIIGIFAFIFISLGILNLESINIFSVGNFLVSVSFLLLILLISIIVIYFLMSHHQKKALIKLYLEKDKIES